MVTKPRNPCLGLRSKDGTAEAPGFTERSGTGIDELVLCDPSLEDHKQAAWLLLSDNLGPGGRARAGVEDVRSLNVR
jgi:hypothetical protein